MLAALPLTKEPTVAALSRFAEAELLRLDALKEPEETRADVEELNGLFRRDALG